MKTFVALLALAVVAAAEECLEPRQNRCNADNCARAVTGTAFPNRPTRVDCSSFLRITVTPIPFTSTITTTNTITFTANTVTTFIGQAAPIVKRQGTTTPNTVRPTALPDYAAPCSGTVRYSSACSCLGVFPTTTTAPLPTVFTTVSTVVTATFVPVSTVRPGTRPACGSVVQGRGPCGCTYNVTCNQKWVGGRIISTVTNISEQGCIDACDRFDNCFNADYSRITGVCTIYERAQSSQAVRDDDAFAFAGTCTSDGTNPLCITG